MSEAILSKRLEIKNRLGLHARAAAQLVEIARQFDADISIVKDGQAVDGKSILGILLLAASQGTRIVISVSGEDEVDAFAAVEDLVTRSFDEGE